MTFAKILIANRGEIACRVIRSARKLGIRTVAVYSTADRDAAHVVAADEAVWVGPPPVAHSYLSVPAILAAAVRSGADAIHPGYGFLSENAEFAAACEEAGVTFIGPPAAAIELMGNKRAAKDKLAESGVPCVPGYHGTDQSDATLTAEAARIGYPVMVKAAAGGGGRGMRLVDGESALAEALAGARAEAKSAFGSDELLLEKAVVRPRHVEVQVFADTHGNVIHLGERDCSVQRRHQKVIEESPSPAVDAALREKMGTAAVAAARACDYVGAGTVEFLLDQDRSFYFLEMNTRLQVEHPVTELVTGVDLVEWQIRVAAGEALPLAQEQVELSGHAVEARLYAEDPRRGFLPQTGEVLRWQLPTGTDIRVDHAVIEGGAVSPHYDPMLGKFIAHGPTRDDALRILASVLEGTTLFGLHSNKSFLASICRHPTFVAGEGTTAFLSDEFADDPSCRVQPPSDLTLAVAAVALFVDGASGIAEDDSFIGWRSGGPLWSTMIISSDETTAVVDVSACGRGPAGRRYQVTRAGVDAGDDEPAVVTIEVVGQQRDQLEVIVDHVRKAVRWARAGDSLWLDDGSAVTHFIDATHRPQAAAGAEASGRLVAPLDGSVIGVRVAEGDAVEKGQLVLVLEAMKMEHRIVAEIDGVVAAIHVTSGDQVKTRQLLAEIAAPESQ